LGEPLRAPFDRARVGLSAPSLASSLRDFASGSAAIPLAKMPNCGINTKYDYKDNLLFAMKVQKIKNILIAAFLRSGSPK
jgi:hypothetical protein